MDDQSKIRADLAQTPAPVRVKDFTVEVVRGDGGNLALYFNDYRVAGGKPWGGGTTLYEFKVKANDAKSSGILAALEAPDAGVVAELVEALRDIADPKRLTSHGDPAVLRNRAATALAKLGGKANG